MTLLEVPFAEKEQAKALGARWNPVEKKWYVPDELKDSLESFARWLPAEASQQILLEDTHNETETQKGIRLSELMGRIQTALRTSFPGGIWVQAEIANLNERRGHIYLELSEMNEQGQAIATSRAMIWQSQVDRILSRFQQETGSELEAGQKILLLAEINFHEKFGFSLVIQDIDPAFTLGELEANLNQIRQSLIQDKLYDLNKQLALAKDFFRIAVIAPPSAAGLGDFRADADRLQQQNLCEFKYFYSAFQGEQVESEMLAAFDAFQALHLAKPYDALVIIRGGGAKLDLNPLNLLSLAKRITQMDLPVLTGIGHERDNTILDEVAHSRFDTPSKVIAFIRHSIFTQAQQAKNQWQLIERQSLLQVQKQQNELALFEQMMQQNSLKVLHKWQEKLTPSYLRIEQTSHKIILKEKGRLQQSHQAIHARVEHSVNLKKQQLNYQFEQVKNQQNAPLTLAKKQIQQWIGFILSSGPQSQLNRGFVICKHQNKVIKTAQQAKQHSSLSLQFQDENIKVIVENKE